MSARGRRSPARSKPLAGRRQQGVRSGQQPRQGAKLAAPPLQPPQRRSGEPPPQRRHRRQQIGTHRHHHLGRGGRCRCPHIGGKVDKGHVRLVAHSETKGIWLSAAARTKASSEKAQQILQRPAATGDDQHVGPGIGRPEAKR